MTPDEAAAAVRAGIRIDPDEPTVWMVDLERQALAALDVLVAAAQRADRLAALLQVALEEWGEGRLAYATQHWINETRAALVDDGGAG